MCVALQSGDWIISDTKEKASLLLRQLNFVMAALPRRPRKVAPRSRRDHGSDETF